ncbi:MAG: clan AA aspartic protease [Treponema sp.]|jgi:clan AA aspartic protease|nr:clan AA aspartic protease [Treponema sp.]
MSLVYTEITLKNAVDVAIAKAGMVKEHEIRETTVRAQVDTGAWTLIINDEIRQKLGVETLKSEQGTLADGSTGLYELVGPVEVIWRDRSTNCDALVLPNADEILLGAIPLEALDLIVNPRAEEVAGAHGDQIIHSIKTYSKNKV